MRKLLLLLSSLTSLLLFATTAQAYDNLYLDPFSNTDWSSQYGFQTCAGYSGNMPCISDGTYFGTNTGDVVFSYTNYSISNSISITSAMRNNYDSHYFAIDMMTGPRNDEQGNKTEYVVITVTKKNIQGSTLETTTFNESVSNTTMETYAYDIGLLVNVYYIDVTISGKDGGFWSGNYGAVLGAGSLYFSDSDPTNTGPETTTTAGTSLGPTSTQTTIKSSARTRASTYNSNSDNSVYIDQAGDNNTVTITQQGPAGNHVRGIDGANAGVITGDSNTLDLKQGASTSTGINLIELSVIGSTNDILLYQDRWDDGSQDTSAGGGHTISLDLLGNLNTIDVIQRNNAGNDGNYLGIDLVGNSNNISVIQRSDAGVTAFIDVTGDNNLVDLTQDYTAGGGNHFADITLIGNGHNVDLTQSGSGSHNATISLTNGSAPSSLDLSQSGSTDQSYSLEQTCYTVGGCSATVTQN